MEKTLRITAVSGWGLSTDWFARQIKEFFPQAAVTVLYPVNPADPTEAKNLLDSAPADLYIGYSLGSLWLLSHRGELPEISVKAVLAPILGFAREKKLGGKISRRHLNFLMEQVKGFADVKLVLKEFCSFAGLSLPDAAFNQAPNRDALIRGIEFLDAHCVSERQGDGFLAIMGDEDRVSDAELMAALLPHVEIVKGANHSPEPLLERLNQLYRQYHERNRHESIRN